MKGYLLVVVDEFVAEKEKAIEISKDEIRILEISLGYLISEAHVCHASIIQNALDALIIV